MLPISTILQSKQATQAMPNCFWPRVAGSQMLQNYCTQKDSVQAACHDEEHDSHKI
jgi:hypothetical protein